MKIYPYPCEKFLSKIKSEIIAGNDFNIEILKSWRSNLITKKIITLISNEKSNEKSWMFIFCIFLNPSFFSAYFYAISEKYSIEQADESMKIITFKKDVNL